MHSVVSALQRVSRRHRPPLLVLSHNQGVPPKHRHRLLGSSQYVGCEGAEHGWGKSPAARITAEKGLWEGLP